MDRSGIAHWESGRRVPDVVMLSRLSECLGLELSVLMRTAEGLDERPKVILVDDEKLILNGAIPILEEAMPGAEVAGFTIPSRALAYAIVVEDTGPGFAPSDDDEPHIALANIRERLEMICRGTLTVRHREGGGTRVTVWVPRQKTEDSDSFDELN